MPHPLDFSDGFGVLIKRDGRAYRFNIQTPTPIEASDEIMARIASQQGKEIIQPFDINGAACKMVLHKENTALVSFRIRVLTLRTYWMPLSDNQVLVPTWNNVPNSVEFALRWPVPDSMRLHFAAECVRAGGMWKVSEPILFATHVPTVNGFWRLPLPNMYDDGKICLGRDPSTHQADPSLHLMLTKVLAKLAETRWGVDLPPNLTNSQAMFRFNMYDHSPIYYSGEWSALCRKGEHTGRVNHPLMEEAYFE